MRRQFGFTIPVALVAPLLSGLGVALALSWLGSGIALTYFRGQVTTLEGQVSELREAIGKEAQSRAQFQGAAAACTKSVNALLAEGEANRAAFLKGLPASQAATRQSNAIADRILSQLRPAGLDECQAMLKELNSEIDRRKGRKG